MKRVPESHYTTVPPGLLIFGAENEEVLNDARPIITDQVLGGGNALGMQFDKCRKVISLYGGTAYQQKHVLARHRYFEPSASDVAHEVIMVGSRNGFDFCCDEASATIKPMIRAAKEHGPAVFIFCQNIDSGNDLLLADMLTQYRHELVQAGATGIAMLACSDGFKDSDLPQLCEEFIEVEEAEPDFDMDCAIAFDCHSLRGLRRFGVGKTMCSLQFSAGRVSPTFMPFISASARERAMWWMRCADYSYAEIGEPFGINKSTVMRQLRKLPNTMGHDVDKSWLRSMLENLDLVIDPLEAESEPSSRDEEEDDDFDEDDDET